MNEERRQATTIEERAAVRQEKKNHIEAIMADRAVSGRTNRAAEEHSKVPSVDGINQLLKITMDGMDQAKFRCPRNLASSAEFEIVLQASTPHGRHHLSWPFRSQLHHGHRPG